MSKVIKSLKDFRRASIISLKIRINSLHCLKSMDYFIVL